MKNRKKGRSFGRKRDAKKAFLRSLIRAVVLNEKIKTTHTRAKELRPLVERLVTYSKKGGIHTRRQLLKKLGNDKEAVLKLTTVIAPRYMDRNGGYMRIVKIQSQRKDAAKEAVIEFV